MGKELLSDIIKSFRTKHGLSQEDLALRCGLSKAYIGVLERGYDPNTLEPTKPSIGTYEKLALGMGMSQEELMFRVEDLHMFEKVIAYRVPIVRRHSDIASVYFGNDIITDRESYVNVSEDVYKERRTVAIRIEDETLFPKIQKNDIAIVRLDEPCSSGDFVLTYCESKDSLRCYRINKENYPSILFGNLSINPISIDSSLDILILGKVILVQRNM